VDWVIGFAYCGRKCLLGALKVIVKAGHKYIPIFGIMEWFAEVQNPQPSTLSPRPFPFSTTLVIDAHCPHV